MDIASSKGVIVSESWAGGCASILARDNIRHLDDMFRTVCAVEILALVDLTLAHIGGLTLRILLIIACKRSTKVVKALKQITIALLWGPR
jgi:hypothetical protein